MLQHLSDQREPGGSSDHDISQHFGIKTELIAQCKSLCHRHHLDGESHVVAGLSDLSSSVASAVENVLAHCRQHWFGPLRLIDVTSNTASFGAPTMNDSVAFCAPTTPPDTGASTKVSPCFSASSDSSFEPIGSIVLQSMLKADLLMFAM